MAITNAQQYQQLVNKPTNGKRPGYRGSDYGDQARGTGAYSGGPPGNTGGGSTDRSRTSARQDYNTAIATGKNPLGLNLSAGPPDLTPQEKEFNKQNNLSFSEKFKINSLKNLYDQKFGLKKATPSLIGMLNTFTPSLNVYEKSDPNLDNLGMKGEDLTDTDRLAEAINNAEATGDITQGEFESAFFGPDGPPEPPKGGDGIQDPCKGPNPPAYCFTGLRSASAATPEVVEEDEIINYRLMADGGRAELAEGGMPYEGGIMDLESSRQMYGLGKLVKKVTRSVKKIAKSPIGKAALLYAGGTYLGGLKAFGGAGFGSGNFLTNLGSGQGIGNLFNFGKNKLFGEVIMSGNKAKGAGYLKKGLLSNKALMGIGIPTALSYFMTPEEEEEQKLYAGADIDNVDTIINNPRDYINPRLMAEGGSTEEKEPVAKKVMPLLDMEGQEKDYRETGGFVDMGRMEKADDVPARLSKNEFVFTADAVRNAGDGSVDKGAEVMYNMMKNLESGGDVSEESQGLEGARDMFKTSQRLEEVL